MRLERRDEALGKTLKALITYNGAAPSKILQLIGIVWILVFVIGWAGIAGPFIPSPLETFIALKDYWLGGFAEDIKSSLVTVIEGTLLSILFGLPLAYLVRVPLFRPLVEHIARTRFNGISGILFALIVYLSGGHWLKVAIIVYGVTPYILSSMAQVVISIPDTTFDYAKTLRMGTLEAVWEMVIVGEAYSVAVIVKQNIAMACLMLMVVEGLVRSEGGLGKLMADAAKFMNIANLYAIQFTIWGFGFALDQGLGFLIRKIFKHEFIGKER